MRCIAFVSAGIAFVSADTNANLTAMNALFVVIIVTVCGRHIIDRFNQHRGNKTTEGSEKE